jgi:hypothetical protein
LVHDVRQLGAKDVDDRSPEGMGVMELHDALALPRPWSRRTRIAVDHHDVVATPCKGDGGEQASGARPHDDHAHD